MTGALWMLLLRSGPRGLCSRRAAWWAPTQAPPLARCALTTGSQAEKENKRTVEKLCELAVDIRKIRRFKGWVLLEEETYVEEVVSVLRQLGADAATVASILERCPEAMVCSPAALAAQRELWQLVCRSEQELVTLIERCPEAFFTIGDQENLRLNVQFFQELGLRNLVISRFLTTAPSIFHNPVENNKQMARALQESFLSRGGSEANMRVWLLKLLSQNPFILFNSPVAVRETLEFLQEQGFTDLETLQLL